MTTSNRQSGPVFRLTVQALDDETPPDARLRYAVGLLLRACRLKVAAIEQLGIDGLPHGSMSQLDQKENN